MTVEKVRTGILLSSEAGVLYYTEAQIFAGFRHDPSNSGAGFSHVQGPLARQD